MRSLTSVEILEKVSDSGVAKANSSIWKLFLLAVLAGAFIAFGANGSMTVSFGLLSDPDPLTFGIGKLVSAAVFPVGLMMVVLCGAELFTGNTLMVTGLLDGKIKVSGMLKNWIIVYIGNFVGALLIAALINYSGLLESGGGMLGAFVVKTAAAKTSLSFGRAFVLGMMCNWLVCLAVWMSTGATETIGKIFSILFCIGLFVLSGFEHSIANMYFIPAGIMASGNSAFVDLLGTDISGLTVSGFLTNNLLPVTLGNIVGGCGFVGVMYWVCHRKGK